MKRSFLFSFIAVLAFSIFVSCEKSEEPIKKSDDVVEQPKDDTKPQDNQGGQGNQNDQGEQGNQNNQGGQGNQNNQGGQGNQNNQGEQGNQNNQGEQGNQNDQGGQGNQNDQGEQGNQNDQGEQGNQNNQGGQDNQNNQGNNTSNENDNRLFVYKVYIEQLTGSWCSYCPRVIYVIENMKKVAQIKDRIVPVAIHRNGSYYDPMAISQSDPIEQYNRGKFGLTGLPFFARNRDEQLFASNAVANIDNFLKENQTSPIGIKIKSTLNSGGGKVSVSFKFKENYENLKYSVFIVEDKHKDYQTNRTEYYRNITGKNFEHNDVLRAIYGDALGNNLGAVTNGQELVKKDLEVTYQLKTGNINNAKVVVFISDSSGKVLNVQEAKANQEKDYQYAQ